MIIAEDIQHSSGRSMKGSYGYTRRALGLVILKDSTAGTADALKARTMPAQANE